MTSDNEITSEAANNKNDESNAPKAEGTDTAGTGQVGMKKKIIHEMKSIFLIIFAQPALLDEP